MTTQIQYRRDTAANWTTNNPTLLAGEIGYETDTGLTKIGDGATVWTSLLYQGRNTFRLLASASAIGPSIADYFANAAITLDAASTYEYEMELFFTKTTAATVTFTLTSSNAPVNLNAFCLGSSTAITSAAAPTIVGVVGSTSATAAAGPTQTLAAGSHHFTVKGIVETHATLSSTFKLQITSASGTVTPLRGSYITIVRRPNTNIGAFA